MEKFEKTFQDGHLIIRLEADTGSGTAEVFQPVRRVFFEQSYFELKELESSKFTRDDYFVISLCKEGSVEWCFEKNRNITRFHRNNIYVENGYFVRKRSVFPEGIFRGISIFFRKEFITKFVRVTEGLEGFTQNYFNPLLEVTQCLIEDDRHLVDIMLALENHKDDIYCFQLHLLELLHCIVSVLNANGAVHHFRGTENLVSEIKEYMKEHLSQGLTQADLSEHFDLPKNFLRNDFRKTVGCSPTDYMVLLRAEEAGRQLTETDRSIGDIAAALGYQNASKFAKEFQRVTGLLPREYRRLYTGKSRPEIRLQDLDRRYE